MQVEADDLHTVLAFVLQEAADKNAEEVWLSFVTDVRDTQTTCVSKQIMNAMRLGRVELSCC